MKGYTPLKKDFKNLKQVVSEDMKNLKELHIQIINIIRMATRPGLHHHCSKERMQNYLDEYYFRYNRRLNMDTIFDVLIRKILNYKEILI